jgi:hypothetical protein
MKIGIIISLVILCLALNTNSIKISNDLLFSGFISKFFDNTCEDDTSNNIYNEILTDKNWSDTNYPKYISIIKEKLPDIISYYKEICPKAKWNIKKAGNITVKQLITFMKNSKQKKNIKGEKLALFIINSGIDLTSLNIDLSTIPRDKKPVMNNEIDNEQ